MAVDYGDAHTGLACCDRTQTLASPIGVIDERNFQTCVEKVAAAAVEYEVGEVVVGNPINMNGTYGPRSEKCRMFADMLQNFLEIPVVMWDERSTTVTAHNMMNDVNKRGKERKKVIDAVAAAVDVALTPVDLVGRSLLSGGGHGLLPGSGARLGCASEECGTRGSRGSQARERAFDEGAARQGGLGFSHSPSSS